MNDRWDNRCPVVDLMGRRCNKNLDHPGQHEVIAVDSKPGCIDAETVYWTGDPLGPDSTELP